MKIKLRNAAIFLLGALASHAAGHAQAALKGRVVDGDTGIALDGVVVTIPEADLRTVTRRGGEYLFDALASGSYTLQFDYLGFESETRQVTVQNGAELREDVRLRQPLAELEGIRVSAEAIGQARALNFQKNSSAYANVIASDAIGEFPDQNAAEALSRLPGVSVERDQGEGRFVIVRGIDPNLNSVSIDGVKLASPSAGERATLLDTIPSDNLQQVEVYKTTLPSQPGDSVGGYINIKSPSAFDDEGTIARLALQGNYSELVDEWKGKVSGAFGTTFADDAVGLMVSASFDEREFGSDNNESDPWSVEDGEDGSSGYVSEAMELREYDLARERIGVTANLEFKPAERQYYFLRGSWNDFEDTEIRHAGVIETETFSAIGDDSFEALDTEVVREFKDRTESMRVIAFSAGGENRFGNLDVDYKASFSTAEEDTPFDFEAIYELEDEVDLLVGDTRSSVLDFTQIGGPDWQDPSLYEFDEVELENQLVEEDDVSFEANFSYDFDSEVASELNFGFLYRDKEKTGELEVFKSDDNPAEADTLENFLFENQRDPFNHNLPLVSPRMTSFFLENRDAFAMERDEVDSAIEDFVSNEDVFAAYLEGRFNLGAWELIAGFRVEDTDFETSGFQFDEETETISSATGENSYTDFLPGIHLKRAFGENTVLRFSWNNTISRPVFEQTIPFAEIDNDEVEVGNPDLDSLESSNFDVSVERYIGGLGLVSAAVFYKDVENFIFEQTLFEDFGDIENAEVTTFRNGPSGDILGLELTAQRQLDFLPGPLDGLGVYANFTFVDSEADALPAEEGDPLREIPFVKQSDTVGNVALTYEKAGFFLRVAGTWRDEYLDEVGESIDDDRFVDDHFQLDVSARYEVVQGVSFFANFINLNDEPFEARFKGSGRLSQFEAYDWSANAGVKWSY